MFMKSVNVLLAIITIANGITIYVIDHLFVINTIANGIMIYVIDRLFVISSFRSNSRTIFK